MEQNGSTGGQLETVQAVVGQGEGHDGGLSIQVIARWCVVGGLVFTEPG